MNTVHWSVLLYFQDVLGEIKTYNFAKKTMYSNVIPTSDLAVVDGNLSRIECTLLCGYEITCQTFFYKRNDRSCFLHKYPLLNNTPVNIESGVEIFEIKGKLSFNTFGSCEKVFFVRGIHISLKFHTDIFNLD